MKIDFTPRLFYTGLIAGAAVGAVTLGYGIYKDAKANSKAKELAKNRPELTSSPYTAEQLSLSRNELANGMGADASRFLQEGNDRNLSTSLDALLKGGGDVNNVAQIFDGSQQGNQRLALQKENLRLNNINNFMNASKNADQERQQQFQFNNYGPWADQSQANAQAKAAAGQTINSGINTLASGVTGALANGANNRAMTNYLNGGQVADNYVSPNSQSFSNNTGLETGGYTPSVVGGSNPQSLNLDFNNSSNTNPWNIPGGS